MNCSEWNQENLFCGWYDADLSEKGIEEAKQAGKVCLITIDRTSFDKFFFFSGLKNKVIHLILRIHRYSNEQSKVFIIFKKN